MAVSLNCSDGLSVSLLSDEAAACRVLKRFISQSAADSDALAPARAFRVPFIAKDVASWKDGPFKRSLDELVGGMQVRH